MESGNMPRRCLWFLVVLSAACGLLRCTPVPVQPGKAEPYALVVLPQAIHVLGLDTQTFDPRWYIQEIRVIPGLHSLRFAYEGSSPQHRGQQPVSFLLGTQAGHQYVFEPKTCGISWRPAVAEHTLIVGYCRTHTCTEDETRVPPRIPRTPKCNTD